jgi:hypothetical protein
MGNWYKFLLKIKPDGKAFRSILCSKIFYEVIENAIEIVRDYAILNINDQVWYVNNNFNPEPWERRYKIIPPENATLEDRRIYIKSYMSYPQSQNRLSRDYIYDTLIESGYEGINVEYNSTGDDEGFLHANDFGDEKTSFSMGSLTYNSFILSGELSATFYVSAINLAMSLKPLQVTMYDKIEVLNTIALDDSLALALDDSLALVLTTL